MNPNNSQMLRAPLDQLVSVTTQSTIRCTAALMVLAYDYSYLVVNVGANPGIAYLQISPDNTTWQTQSAKTIIPPSTMVSFVSNVIAKYARLCYQAPETTPSTDLKIYIQGR